MQKSRVIVSKVAPSKRRSPAHGNGVAPSTRERILEAAARLFAEQGFASASMPAIAEQSGITAGAIYRHFNSKAELLFEVVKRALQSLPTAMGEDGRIDVRAVPNLVARYVDRDMKPLRQISLEVHNAAARDREVSSQLIQYDESMFQGTGTVIAAAQGSGAIDARLNPEFTARMISTLIMGLNHMDTLNPTLVGDREWRKFVEDRVALLMGIKGPHP